MHFFCRGNCWRCPHMRATRTSAYLGRMQEALTPTELRLHALLAWRALGGSLGWRLVAACTGAILSACHTAIGNEYYVISMSIHDRER